MVASYTLQPSRDGSPELPPNIGTQVLWLAYGICLPNQPSRGAQQYHPDIEWAEQFSGAVMLQKLPTGTSSLGKMMTVTLNFGPQAPAVYRSPETGDGNE